MKSFEDQALRLPKSSSGTVSDIRVEKLPEGHLDFELWSTTNPQPRESIFSKK